MRIITKGVKVYWNDPVEISSGVYEVLSDYTLENDKDDTPILIGNGNSEMEVFVWELEFETKVVFRQLNETGETVALFPEMVWGTSTDIAYYMHVGQHGSGDYDWFIANSKPSTEQEYKELLDELTNQVGYHNLLIMKKSRPKF